MNFPAATTSFTLTLFLSMHVNGEHFPFDRAQFNCADMLMCCEIDAQEECDVRKQCGCGEDASEVVCDVQGPRSLAILEATTLDTLPSTSPHFSSDNMEPVGIEVRHALLNLGSVTSTCHR